MGSIVMTCGAALTTPPAFMEICRLLVGVTGARERLRAQQEQRAHLVRSPSARERRHGVERRGPASLNARASVWQACSLSLQACLIVLPRSHKTGLGFDDSEV